jgi:hypothetical protein
MRIAPVCAGCHHPALHHEYSPLACMYCALSPLAHAHGMGCGNYTLRERPPKGARCNSPRCECSEGYRPGEEG